MTVLYAKNLSPEKERKVRIFQLTENGGIYSSSDQVVPMDQLNASVGMTLSPFVECEGVVNRGGIIIPRDEDDLENIVRELKSYGVRVDVLEEWGNSAIHCEGGTHIADYLSGSSWGTFELIIDGESKGLRFSFGSYDGNSDRETLRRALQAQGIQIKFYQENM